MYNIVSKNTNSLKEDPSFFQVFTQKMGIVPGSVFAYKNTSKTVTFIQKILGKKESLVNHVSIVLECTKDKIKISDVTLKGSRIKEMDMEEFKKFLKRGEKKGGIDIYADSNQPSEKVCHYLSRVSDNLTAKPLRYDYFGALAIPFRDGRDGKRASIQSALHTIKEAFPSTENGKRRKSLICSTFVQEMITALGILKKEEQEGVAADIAKVEGWQKKCEVSKRNAMFTSPASIAEELRDRGYASKPFNEQNFLTAMIKTEEIFRQTNMDASQQCSIDVLQEIKPEKKKESFFSGTVKVIGQIRQFFLRACSKSLIYAQTN